MVKKTVGLYRNNLTGNISGVICFTKRDDDSKIAAQ